MHITLGTLVLALMTGSAAVALWGIVRFPNVGPTSMPGASANMLAAFVGGTMAVPLMIKIGTAVPLPGKFELAVMSVLPPIVYLFISIGWLVRSLQIRLAPYL
jgi:hypothetical protein